MIVRLLRCDRGTTALEFSALAPVLCLFIIGLMDCGYALYTKQALYHGAQFAARCGALKTTSCSTVDQIKAAAVANSLGMSPPTSTFSVSDATCGKLVTASYDYRPFALISSAFTVTMSARGCYLSFK